MASYPLKLAVVSSILLSGCFGPWHDMDKATFVGSFELGSPATFKRTLTLPAGDAQLILAIPGYRCDAVDDAPISVVVRKGEQIVFSERVPLSAFTWSFGEDSCDAIGYLRGAGGLHASRGKHRMRVDASSTREVAVEVDASEIDESPPRIASVWFVYGARVPTRRIFGDPAEPSTRSSD